MPGLGAPSAKQSRIEGDFNAGYKTAEQLQDC